MADTVSSLTIADTSGVKFTTKLTNFYLNSAIIV